MRTISFTKIAFEQFNDWRVTDKAVQEKIIRLIEDILRNPFDGLGKPEALKHEYKGCWSRRITDEHRIIYQVSETSILIIACKYHY